MGNDAPYYEIDGRRYVRVTRILDQVRNKGLEDWRGRVGNKLANSTIRKSLKVGERVHGLIEADLNGGMPGLKRSDSVEVRNALEAYAEWRRCNPEIHGETERRVHHSKLGYAGTIDLLTPTTLYDWKTSSQMSPLYLLQLVAYLECLRDMGLSVPRNLCILRLDKSIGTFEESWVRDVDGQGRETVAGAFRAFKGLLEYYNETGGLDGTTEDKDTDRQDVEESEVPDAGGGEDREERFLGQRREDPLSGM